MGRLITICIEKMEEKNEEKTGEKKYIAIMFVMRDSDLGL